MNWKTSFFTLNPIKLFINFIEAFSTSDDNNKPSSENNTSALTQERSKTVDEKWDKTWFEAIIRVIATWNNKAMVESEITNIISCFTQFNYPDFNPESGEKIIVKFIFKILFLIFIRISSIKNL